MSEKSLMKSHYHKKDYSNLNMENITDSDYNHAKSICKNFKIKILDEYPDLHLKIDTLLLASKFISVPA